MVAPEGFEPPTFWFVVLPFDFHAKNTLHSVDFLPFFREILDSNLQYIQPRRYIKKVIQSFAVNLMYFFIPYPIYNRNRLRLGILKGSRRIGLR